MGTLIRHDTHIEDVCLLEPQVFGDSRGCFLESWNRRTLAEAGIDAEFVQDNESTSVGGILRGLHFQKEHPQGKLVRCAWGRIYDVVVDIRPGSATFGSWYGAELSSENHRQLWVPPGMAHGFLVLSDLAVFCYKVTDHYHPNDEGGIRWDDPAIGIRWPELPDGALPRTNARDAAFPLLSQVFPNV